MKKGDKSPQVRELQEFLNTQGERLDADGNFGGMTEAAVKTTIGGTVTIRNARL